MMPVPLALWMIVQKGLQMKHRAVVGGSDEGIPFLSVGFGVAMNGDHSCICLRVVGEVKGCAIFGRYVSHTIVEVCSMKNLVLALMCFGLTTVVASAQPKEESIGIGISAGWHQGANLTYVINEDMHLGVQLGLHSSGDNTHPTIVPQFRYFLAHEGNFHPFAVAGLYVSHGGMIGQAYKANTGVLAGVGASYFPAKDVNIYAQVAAVNLPFDTNVEDLSFGIMMPSVGIEWFIW